MSGIHDITTPMHLTDGEDVGTTQTVPSGIIRWEAPPPRGGHHYVQAATALKGQPHAWALVDEQVGPTKPNAAAWRRHLASHAPEGKKFEVREVTVDGKTRVYARYTG